MAAKASGILIRKIARQLPRSTSQPPSTGPMAPAAAPVAAQMPIARPLAGPAKVWPKIARLFGISIAAPHPLYEATCQQGRKPGCKRTAERGECEHRGSRDQEPA